MHTISKKSILITGASSGIGEASALHFDRAGYHVFAGVRQEIHAQALKQKASKRLKPIFLDVTKSKSITQAADEVRSQLGDDGLLGLVNNAGIVVPGPLEYLPIADLKKQFEVNLFGLMAVTQNFLPSLRKAQGRIINIGSVAGRNAFPFIGAYAGSKFALRAVTDALRVELLPAHIRVCLIEPPLIATPLIGKITSGFQNLSNSSTDTTGQPYQEELSVVERHLLQSSKHALPVETVVKAIEHALTAKHPKARYLIGMRSRLMLLLDYLPVGVRDKIIRKFLKIFRKV